MGRSKNNQEDFIKYNFGILLKFSGKKMEVQPQFNQLTQYWLSQLNQMRQANGIPNDQLNNTENCDYAADDADDHDHDTANINASNDSQSDDINACNQNVDFTQFVNLFNQNNENFLAALLKKGANQSTQSTQKQQQNALVPPTPPRTPITPSAQHQQVTIRICIYIYLSCAVVVVFLTFFSCFVNSRFAHNTRVYSLTRAVRSLSRFSYSHSKYCALFSNFMFIWWFCCCVFFSSKMVHLIRIRLLKRVRTFCAIWCGFEATTERIQMILSNRLNNFGCVFFLI